MPPKVKYTKEQMISICLDIIREGGEITARNIAGKLSCSPQPIFSCFENMSKLCEEVREAVTKIYNGYISKGLEQEKPFKNSGMQYIKFADEEPELFKFLFMTKGKTEVVRHSLPQNEGNYDKIVQTIMTSHGFSREKAERIYDHISVYTYGLAMLFVQKTGIFTLEEADEMITQLFYALKEAEK